MSKIEDYNLPRDYLKALLPCFDMLKRCNMVFFDENSSFLKRYWRYSYIITSVIGFYLSLTAYVVKILQGQMELFELAYVLPVYLVCTQALLKAIIVMTKKADIKWLVLQLGKAWRTEHLTKTQLNKKNLLLKKLNFCYGAFYWMNIIGSWQYILAPLLETMFRRHVLGQERGLLLPFACFFSFDPFANWPTYIAVYVFETYSMFRFIYAYLGTEFLMITLCSHLSTEFSILREDLLHLKPVDNGCGSEYKMDMRDIIIKHQTLIKFSEKLDEIFNTMIFVNMSSVTITVCFFSFAAKLARGPVDMANNFVAVVALILPVFNLCYYAQKLMDSSAGMAKSAYHNLWYLHNKQYQKSIWFIIRRSQKPCCLTSMKYTPIALHTFTTVLSTTWSYFSVASSLFADE